MELLTPTIARYLTDEAIAATRDQNSHVDEAPFWYGLRQAYPNAHGILSFTRIGFDLQRTEALVTVRHERNRLVSTHQTLLLRLDGNSWRVVRGNLEHERIGAEVDDGRCVIARGEPAPRVAQPAGVYDFTFVATDGRVERERLDASKARRWGHGGWDFSLGRRLMRIGTHHTDRLSGTWMNIGSDGIPIDSGRNRIPERNGHFCASPIEPGAPRD